MASRRRILIGAGLLFVAVGVYVALHRGGSIARGPTAKQHSVAPDFSLPQLNGQSLQLSAYRGKVVLLDFWATWCTPCREEIPHLVELQNKYRDRGLEIIGVSMDDSPDPVRDFYQRFQMNYPVVMGNADIGEGYGGVLGLPIAFIIDRDGRIYAKHIGATEASVLEQDVRAVLASQ
ncbi:Thioredoxin-like protein [Candidatus Sulfotelmatobacter kueseliae]|uniref:Thioredoxin-like protein n=1 Tax=Candidatus Sulfotelmatobacter kueseliae TaxID=2042962 RepID=A0A2U3KU56_9BACT|nr:Thioredoxin-like protein [Candidatus Sulfotelmatobacter kueseliae]